MKKLRKQKLPTRVLGSRATRGEAVRVELAEFAPGIVPFLGLVAYLRLELYEASANAVTGAPSLKAKDVVARVAGVALSKHRRITEEIRRRGYEPDRLMEPHIATIIPYFERIRVNDWHQRVLTLYLVSGLFDGFFASLAEGLSDGFKAEAIEILTDDTGRDELHELLTAEIANDPAIANSLALWGRRLVGDTLLVTREVLALSEGRDFVESEVEPVTTELIADHIRRMDSLGLTA